jgi:hypothetical protein
MNYRTVARTAFLAATVFFPGQSQVQTYTVVGTGQTKCYGDRSPISAPAASQPFFGQDAQNPGPRPAYKDNGDGTVSDLNTGLMWVKQRGSKVTFDEAKSGASSCRAGGFKDWRMPTIKELYSLIDFNGGYHPEGGSIPYIDTRNFEFQYGDTTAGERAIDCQDWSATEYLGTTMGGNATVFGVNFADGRIKGYPKTKGQRGIANKLYLRYVRGNPKYGVNDFRADRDGTITDRATGLMWAKSDSGHGMDWETALAWVQRKNRERYLGYQDWRLPNAKELQSIVDYGRAPQARESSRQGPAIDPVFSVSALQDGDFPFFWTSTTHLDGPADRQGRAAVYLAFGRATGWMSLPGSSSVRLMDVHGAGAQRSDPKGGNPADFPVGRGPQGDVIRINNFVRLVRNVSSGI